MTPEEFMTIRRLNDREYTALVTDWNRRVRRGMVEPCGGHDWARLPHDTDADPHMVCVHCMRPYRPIDPRVAKPIQQVTARPLRRRSEPL